MLITNQLSSSETEIWGLTRIKYVFSLTSWHSPFTKQDAYAISMRHLETFRAIVGRSIAMILYAFLIALLVRKASATQFPRKQPVLWNMLIQVRGCGHRVPTKDQSALLNVR